jgi:hypothetical protein
LEVVMEYELAGAGPPRALGRAGQALWTSVQREFAIADAGRIELLAQACQAADRAEELAAAIAEDGLMVNTKAGRTLNPAVRAELAERAFICRTLGRLGVTAEPKKPIGRPPSGGLGIQRPWRK